MLLARMSLACKEAAVWHGTKQRWRDRVRKDLKHFGLDDSRTAGSVWHRTEDSGGLHAKRVSGHVLKRDRGMKEGNEVDFLRQLS